jgi:hypothetical protein
VAVNRCRCTSAGRASEHARPGRQHHAFGQPSKVRRSQGRHAGNDHKFAGAREDRQRRRAADSASFPDPAMCPKAHALRDIPIIRKQRVVSRWLTRLAADPGCGSGRNHHSTSGQVQVHAVITESMKPRTSAVGCQCGQGTISLRGLPGSFATRVVTCGSAWALGYADGVAAAIPPISPISPAATGIMMCS